MIKSFGKDFLFGVATSAYQIEGDNYCDWTEWERKRRFFRKSKLSSCGKAADHWKRYIEDFFLLKELGVNAYRFSVEWSRIEPKPGEWNEDALQRYLDMVVLLKKLNIKPMVTLHHFTNPIWLHTDFPWYSEKSIERFEKFAEKVVLTLKDYVKYWITFNEPIVFLIWGYIDGKMPPGLKSLKRAYHALKNMLLAHKCAYDIINHFCGSDAKVSIAHNMMQVTPAFRFNPLDRLLCSHIDRFYNWMLVDAFAQNEIDFSFPTTRKRTIKLNLKDTINFWGINYYTRMHFRFSLSKPLLFSFVPKRRPEHNLSDIGWEIFPEGMEPVLKKVYSKLSLPIIITENGIADRKDEKRISYIKAHLEVLKKCQKNIPIKGYFYWSFLDNYEWLSGFKPRFGLFEVDYDTLKRTKRKSAFFFSGLAKGEIEI